MSKRDYYEVLEVTRTSTDTEIKSSYRRLAMKFHPDRNPGDQVAEERFKEAAEAYSVLADTQKRGALRPLRSSGRERGRQRRRRLRSERLRRLRGHPRWPWQHVRRPVRWRWPPAWRPAARRRSPIRPRDLVRRVGERRANHDSDSPSGKLRDVPRIGVCARILREHVSRLSGTRPGSVPAGILHRRAHLSAVSRRRQNRHQAVHRVPGRWTRRPRTQDSGEDPRRHLDRTAAASAGRRRSRIRRRAIRPPVCRRSTCTSTSSSDATA